MQNTNSEVDNPASKWRYDNEDPQAQASTETVGWSASEFIDHEKQISWFAAVAGISVLLAGAIFLLTRDVVNTAAIVVVAILFAIFGARKPRTLKYVLDVYGIHIGDKLYGYNEFKSFAIMEEGALSSIQLYPFKRFATPISLFFPPEQQEPIVATLGNYLPHEIRKHDPIERLMNRVRF